jgi:HPt (histidine-containing phosphotransfer) domain-containing protein
MKNAIWKKILFFTVIPFLLIFVFSSFTIINTVMRDKTRQAEKDARNPAKFNEANFLGLTGRVMFENRYVYNSWLAYEPNEFDWRDGEHRRDGSGAASRAVYPVLALIVFSALIAYIWRYVSTPIHNLTLAADAISRGDLDMGIAPSRSSDGHDRRLGAQADGGAGFPKDEEPPALTKARKIEELDVDKGVMFIGGASERYLELLRLSQKTLGVAVEKMRKFLRGDLHAFAIEVHGVKGALYNIGADSLAKTAEELEAFAKERNADRCEELFPDFERMAGAFTEALDTALAAAVISKGPGNTELLLDELLKARRSCEKYDAFTASDILAPLARFDYDTSNPGAGAILAEIIDLLDTVDYDKAIDNIGKLIEMLRGGLKGNTRA